MSGTNHNCKSMHGGAYESGGYGVMTKLNAFGLITFDVNRWTM